MCTTEKRLVGTLIPNYIACYQTIMLNVQTLLLKYLYKRMLQRS